MPSWHVHKFWCLSLGISDDVCRRVDEVIDFGKEFKGYRVGHDWCRGSMGRFVLASLLFYQKLGVDEVKAVILHCALDYIESLLKGGFSHGEVFVESFSMDKVCGGRTHHSLHIHPAHRREVEIRAESGMELLQLPHNGLPNTFKGEA